MPHIFVHYPPGLRFRIARAALLEEAKGLDFDGKVELFKTRLVLSCNSILTCASSSSSSAFRDVAVPPHHVSTSYSSCCIISVVSRCNLLLISCRCSIFCGGTKATSTTLPNSARCSRRMRYLRCTGGSARRGSSKMRRRRLTTRSAGSQYLLCDIALHNAYIASIPSHYLPRSHSSSPAIPSMTSSSSPASHYLPRSSPALPSSFQCFLCEPGWQNGRRKSERC